MGKFAVPIMDTLRKQKIIVYALLWALFLLMPPMRFLRIH